MWLPSLAGVASSFQTSGTTITAHATSHTKGSWVELVASAPFDVTMLGVTMSASNHSSGTDTSQLTDIGVGANPNEKVLIANIPTGYSSLLITSARVAWFPIEIPSGTRISARMQAVITVDEVELQLFMFGGSSWSSVPTFQSIDTMGALTASSHGTDLGSGSIVEIIASTAEDYKALGYGVDGAGDTSLTGNKLLTILVGAGAAEKVLIDNIKVHLASAESISLAFPSQGILPMEMNIPAGSRLSADLDAAGDVGLVLYGFR